MRRIMVCLLALAVAVSFMPATAFTGTKTTTVYDEVIKDGNTVYCCTLGGLYKLKVRNGRITSNKRLVAGGISEGHYPTDMKKKGKYIYYIGGTEGIALGPVSGEDFRW